MPITHNKGGSTTLTGDAIDFFRLISVRGAVQLECHGIRMTRGRVQWKQAKAFYNLAGKTKHAILGELNAMVEDARAKQMHVDEDGKATVGGEPVQ